MPSTSVDSGGVRTVAFLVERFHTKDAIYGPNLEFARTVVWLPYIDEVVPALEGENWSHVRQTAASVRAELLRAKEKLEDAEPPACSAEEVRRVKDVIAALLAQPRPAPRKTFARVLKGSDEGLRSTPGFGLLAGWPVPRIMQALEVLYWAGILQVPGQEWWGLLETASRKSNAVSDSAVKKFFGSLPDVPGAKGRAV